MKVNPMRQAKGKPNTKAGKKQARNAPTRAGGSDKHWLKLFGPELFARAKAVAKRDAMPVAEVVALAIRHAHEDEARAIALEYGRDTKALAALMTHWLSETPDEKSDPSQQSSAPPQELPEAPSHLTSREICYTAPCGSGFSYHDWDGSLDLHHPGLGGSSWSARTLIEYLSNVIVDYREALLAGVATKGRADWLVTLVLCEHLRERVCEDSFAFPQSFPLLGLARFRKWSAKDVLYQLCESCMDAEERLRELFLGPGSDPLTALEWAEVLMISDMIYHRCSGESSEVNPSLRDVLEQASLKALEHRQEYSYNADHSALVRETQPAAAAKVAA